MKKLMKQLTTLAAFGAVLFAGACDSLGTTTNPSLDPTPVMVTSTSGQRFVVAVEKDPSAASVSAQIGSAGGKLMLGHHVLSVSRDAVSQPTTFTMSREAEDPLKVKLSAGPDNVVGAAGFNAPVTLSMSYLDLTTTPPDLEDMLIAYVRPDGLVEPLPSQTLLGEWRVAAELPHFSLFSLIWP